MSFEEKVEVDLGEGTKPTALDELNKVKKEPVEEFVDAKGRDFYLLVGVGLFLFGGLMFSFILNPSDVSVVPDLNVTSDTNVTEEHLALARLEINDANVLFWELQSIKNSLGVLQVQHICGVNELILDSNQVVENEQGTFVTYQCYARIGDAT